MVATALSASSGSVTTTWLLVSSFWAVKPASGSSWHVYPASTISDLPSVAVGTSTSWDTRSKVIMLANPLATLSGTFSMTPKLNVSDAALQSSSSPVAVNGVIKEDPTRFTVMALHSSSAGRSSVTVRLVVTSGSTMAIR